MTKKDIMTKANDLKNDIIINDYEDDYICITLNDFEGFDDNYNEINREFDDINKVNEFIDFLDNNCIEKVMDFYTEYIFEDCKIVLGYASYDI